MKHEAEVQKMMLVQRQLEADLDDFFTEKQKPPSFLQDEVRYLNSLVASYDEQLKEYR